MSKHFKRYEWPLRMNIFVRKIDYADPQDELPSGGAIEFDDEGADNTPLEEYGHDAWVFLEQETGQTINGFEASFVEDFSSQAYHFVRNEAGDGFVIFDISDENDPSA